MHNIHLLPIFGSFKAILNVFLLWNLPGPGRATRAGTDFNFFRHGAARILNFFAGAARANPVYDNKIIFSSRLHLSK